MPTDPSRPAGATPGQTVDAKTREAMRRDAERAFGLADGPPYIGSVLVSRDDLNRLALHVRTLAASCDRLEVVRETSRHNEAELRKHLACRIEAADRANREAERLREERDKAREKCAKALECADARLADMPHFPIRVDQMSGCEQAIAEVASHACGALLFIQRVLANPAPPARRSTRAMKGKRTIEKESGRLVEKAWRRRGVEDLLILALAETVAIRGDTEETCTKIHEAANEVRQRWGITAAKEVACLKQIMSPARPAAAGGPR